MRFRYEPARPLFDRVTRIELGDLSRGYRAIDISGASKELYSLAGNLYLGLMLASMPRQTNGALSFAPKKKDGTPLGSRADALPTEQSGPYLLPPKGTIDMEQVVPEPTAAASMEIKEWQAIMGFLKSLPMKNAQGITVLAMDERAREDRSLNESLVGLSPGRP
jgi:5'-nucleotidase